MRTLEIAPTAIWTATAPAALQGRCVLQSSLLRDKRFEVLLRQTDPFGAEELTAFMSDHGEEGVPSDDTVCMHGGYRHTTACLQFYPQSRQIRVSYSSTCRESFSVITFS